MLNRNRLHLLISRLVAAGSLAYFASGVPSRYREFVQRYKSQRGQQYIEKTTGMRYYDWETKHFAECSRQHDANS